MPDIILAITSLLIPLLILFYGIIPLFYLFTGREGKLFWAFQKKLSIVLFILFVIAFVITPLYFGIKLSIEKSSWIPLAVGILIAVGAITGGAKYRIKIKKPN